MDLRYLLAALVLVGAGVTLDWLRWTDIAAAWSVPFAVVLLFLAALGESAGERLAHYFPDPPIEPPAHK